MIQYINVESLIRKSEALGFDISEIKNWALVINMNDSRIAVLPSYNMSITNIQNLYIHDNFLDAHTPDLGRLIITRLGKVVHIDNKEFKGNNEIYYSNGVFCKKDSVIMEIYVGVPDATYLNSSMLINIHGDVALIKTDLRGVSVEEDPCTNNRINIYDPTRTRRIMICKLNSRLNLVENTFNIEYKGRVSITKMRV